MISGRFGSTSGRPYVSGRLLLPRLGLSANLSFLVDTGADRSTLMPADGVKMGIDYSTLGNPSDVGGMGGNTSCFQEDAIMGFIEADQGITQYYSVSILIPDSHPDLMNMPPILGRDVLDRWHMSYDPSNASLEFIVQSSDASLP